MAVSLSRVNVVSNIFAEDAEVLLFGLTKGDRLRCGVNVRGWASTMVAVGDTMGTTIWESTAIVEVF